MSGMHTAVASLLGQGPERGLTPVCVILFGEAGINTKSNISHLARHRKFHATPTRGIATDPSMDDWERRHETGCALLELSTI